MMEVIVSAASEIESIKHQLILFTLRSLSLFPSDSGNIRVSYSVSQKRGIGVEVEDKIKV